MVLLNFRAEAFFEKRVLADLSTYFNVYSNCSIWTSRSSHYHHKFAAGLYDKKLRGTNKMCQEYRI